ncbi:acyl carrier protein [Massilia violaceinigra]|uniref:Acyl carrier protein n=2 Tax=Massilia TaxID=149698 RepID=A0ABY4A4P5_9BURK|nr:acyl carrier protein [Massilia violaceinigra]UOD29701.1 acyl carrier protein [Massilia violaceinigra]
MLGNKLLAYIAENYLGGESQQFALDTPLLELNIIDSSALFDLVDLLRREAGVTVPLKAVVPNNFKSVQHMLDLVERLQSESRPALAQVAGVAS